MLCTTQTTYVPRGADEGQVIVSVPGSQKMSRSSDPPVDELGLLKKTSLPLGSRTWMSRSTGAPQVSRKDSGPAGGAGVGLGPGSPPPAATATPTPPRSAAPMRIGTVF